MDHLKKLFDNNLAWAENKQLINPVFSKVYLNRHSSIKEP